MFPVELKH